MHFHLVQEPPSNLSLSAEFAHAEKLADVHAPADKGTRITGLSLQVMEGPHAQLEALMIRKEHNLLPPPYKFRQYTKVFRLNARVVNHA